MFFLRRNRSRPLLYVYIATLVIFLVAAFVLHASGTTLTILRVARIVVIVALLAVGAFLRRRNAATTDAAPQRGPERD